VLVAPGEVPNNHANNLSSLLIPEDGQLIFTNNILEGSWFKLEERLPCLAIPVVRIGCRLPVFFPDFLCLICLINIMPRGGYGFFRLLRMMVGMPASLSPLVAGVMPTESAKCLRRCLNAAFPCFFRVKAMPILSGILLDFSLQLRLSDKMHSNNLISLTGKQLKIGHTAF
jgi:hypothetical protein